MCASVVTIPIGSFAFGFIVRVKGGPQSHAMCHLCLEQGKALIVPQAVVITEARAGPVSETCARIRSFPRSDAGRRRRSCSDNQMYNPQADISVLHETEEPGASPPVPGLLQASPEPLSQPSVPPQAMLSRDPGFPQRHGRHTPYVTQPDYRLYELNKRLQARTEESDSLWWDAFATEFFEDDATLTLCFCLEDGPKRYTIGRTLIPRYFRSIFDGGVSELYFTLRNSKESFHNNAITLDCEQCCMVSQHGKPMFIKVCTDGRLILEFAFDDMMRIRTWHFSIRQHRELISRNLLAVHTQDPPMLEQLSKNITRNGLTNITLNYLRLCVILEPMQELMSRHKTYNISPRDCLKTCLFQKWQRMVAPPAEPSRPPAKKRRKRNNSASSTSNSSIGQNNGTTKKKSPASSNFSLASQGGRAGRQDVMVVGEPTLMGGEFGDEDERLITRLENTQYDAANGLDDDDDFGHSPALANSSPWSGKPPTMPDIKTENPTSQASQ